MEIPLLLYMIILILMIIPIKSLLFSLFVARFPIYVQFMITSIIWQFPYNLLANSLVVFLFAGRFPIYSTINNSMAISGTDLLEVYYHILEVPFPSKNGYSHRHHGGALILCMGTGWVMLGHSLPGSSAEPGGKVGWELGPERPDFRLMKYYNSTIIYVKFIFICSIYIYVKIILICNLYIYICKNYTYM